MVLDRLSQTHTHTYIYITNYIHTHKFLHTDTAGPWFWPLILHLFPAARIARVHSKNTWHKFWNRKRASKENVKFTTISKGNASPSPRETLSPTFPPAPVIVLVQRWNFHNPDPSKLHGKSMNLSLYHPISSFLCSFAAGTFFMVLDRLSHTHTHIQIKSTLTNFYILTQLVLDFGLWFFIFFLQHVSQEFIPKIFDTSFEIVSVHPRSTSKFTISKANASPWPIETLSSTFPPAPVIVLVQRWNFHNPDPSRLHGKSIEFCHFIT